MEATFRLFTLALVLYWLLLPTPLLAQQTADPCTDIMAIAERDWDAAIASKKNKENTRAIALFERALRGFATCEDHEGVVECYLQQARVAGRMGDGLERIRYAGLAHRYAQNHLPDTSDLHPIAAEEQGGAYLAVGRTDPDGPFLDSAAQMLDVAIEGYRSLEIWEKLGWCYSSKATACYYIPRLEEAEEALSKMLALTEERAEELTPNLVSAMRGNAFNLYSVVKQKKGEYNEAISYINEAINLERSKPTLTTRDSSFISSYFHILGTYYNEKGDYVRALDYFLERAEPMRPNAQFNDVSKSYNIGSVLLRLGNYEESIRYSRRSLELNERKGPRKSLRSRARALSNLASAYRSLGEYDTAIYHCQQALAVPRNPMTFLPWTTIGRIHLAQSEPVLALDALQKALDIYTNKSTKSYAFFKTDIYRFLGDAHQLNEAADSALLYYQKAIVANHPVFRDSTNHFNNPVLDIAYDPLNFLETLEGKAGALASLADERQYAETAIATYTLAFDWLDTLNTEYRTEASQLDWSKRYYSLSEAAVSFAYDRYVQTKDEMYLKAAFAFMERSKNGILREQLRAAEGMSYGGVPDSLTRKESDILIDLAYYQRAQRKALLEGDETRGSAFSGFLASARLELADLRDRMNTDYPRYQEFREKRVTKTYEEIQANLLTTNDAFLSYLMGQDRSFVFVLGKKQADILELAAADSINGAVEEWRSLTFDLKQFQRNARAAVKDYNRVSHDLFQLVMTAALASLPDEVSNLLVVPDGALHAVPFSVLTSGETDAGNDFGKLPYVLNDYRVQYAYSADLQLESKGRNKDLRTTSKCLAFAPSYGAGEEGEPKISQRNAAGPLAGTAEELKAIEKWLRGEFVIGERATEARFVELAPDYGVLHLAMHGVADREDPSFNHLVFAHTEPAAGAASDEYLLYHEEIANLPLSARLAVLSACETGVGRYELGEGLYSLARSFFSAGVPSVIMSLWRADDRATSEMMPLFYKRLAAGEKKDAALIDAQKEYLTSADLEFRHPYYWAAFVGLGDTTPIKNGWGWGWYSLLAAAALAMVGWQLFKRGSN